MSTSYPPNPYFCFLWADSLQRVSVLILLLKSDDLIFLDVRGVLIRCDEPGGMERRVLLSTLSPHMYGTYGEFADCLLSTTYSRLASQGVGLYLQNIIEE